MLGTIIEKLSSLVSKAAFVSSFLPLVAFAAANVLLFAYVHPGFREWLIARRSDPELWSVGVLTFAIASLAFTTINTRLRELMEGRFWPQFLCGAFTASERRLDVLNSRYSTLQRNRRGFVEEAAWNPRLTACRKSQPKTPGHRYAPNGEAATMVRSLRRTMVRGEVITPQAVARAVDALCPELTIGPDNPIDPALDADLVALRAVIDYAPARTQQEIARLFTQRQFEFPDRNLAPTAMGNVARSIRSYTMSRYQLDIERVWTRLQKVMQGEAFYTVLQESKTQLDFLVSLFWLASTFTAIWLVAFAALGYSLPIFLAVGLAGPLVVWALWGLALQNYRAFADLMRCSVDMYRLALLEQLRLPQPGSSDEEALLWTALQNRMDYDNKFSLSYRPALMKLGLVGLYVVVLAAGAAAILARSRQPAEYTAARRLEKGHQIQDADLRAPDRRWALASGLPSRSSYAGRFLDRAVERAQPVKRAYLVDRPPAAAAGGMVAYAWYLRDTDREWSRVLDVGWLVDLCADTCPVMGAPVLAVDCRSPGGTDCVAILQLTPDQLKTILAYQGKQKLRIAVSEARVGG